jgi:hypothetical protein
MSSTIQLRPGIKEASVAIGSVLACAVPNANAMTYAVSTSARNVDRHIFESRAAAENSISLFGEKSQALSILAEVVEEASKDDWDGYGAYPVCPKGVELAKAFIRALPKGISMPEPCAEPDGEIALEWYGGKNRIFSISFGKEDRLAYASIDGTDRDKGVRRFDGVTISPLFLQHIQLIVR